MTRHSMTTTSSCIGMPRSTGHARVLEYRHLHVLGLEQSQIIIDGIHKVLPGPEVPLGGLNRSMSEQQFESAPSPRWKLCITSPQVVGRKRRVTESH